MAAPSTSTTAAAAPPPSSAAAASAIATATPTPTGAKQAPPAAAAAAPAPSATSTYLLSSYFITGGVAGAASRTSVAPLERLKIIYQVQNSQAYGGVLSALRKIWVEEGIKGMFRGNGVNCLRIIPYSATQFASYEQIKKLLTDNGRVPLDTPARLTAGALAGICSVVATYPLDLVRSRLSIVSASIGSQIAQVQANGGTVTASLVAQKELGVVGMTLKVFREEGGIRALYRGIGPTATGVAPYVALNFTFYELLKVYFTPPDRPASTWRKLSCGATAGAISQTLTYPLDVLRRKMQVTGMKDKVDFEYKNSFDAVKTIVAKEGWRGMYKGLTVNLLKVSPSMAISFVSYEATKQWLGA